MNKINEFQQLMIKNNINAYVIPTSDYHESEYVSDYFKVRAYLSGFTGSAGVLLITQDNSYLWTDGRYFIQAANQLVPNKVNLMKMGEKGVPTLTEFLKNNLKENDTLGFDGKTMNTALVESITKNLSQSIKIKSIELINNIWKDRPSLPTDKLFILEGKYSGESFVTKLAKLREKIQDKKAQDLLLTALEDIAWLFNLRGNDVLYTPVFLSYAYITLDTVNLFINKDKLTPEVKAYLDANKVIVHDYFDIYTFISKTNNRVILLDKSKVNYELISGINETNEVINGLNPTIPLKAVKNPVEIANTAHIHELDGAAVTKMMLFAKEYAKTHILNEIAVSDYLEGERKKIPGFIELSFGTICAYKEHGAMMHYSANAETNSMLTTDGFLLVDSGGTYLEGTTDITRTIALGNVTPEMKKHFTLVLKGMINLSRAVFMKGCTGLNLDILARGPIWRELMDYKCGTGHGVGHILSVHEGPNGFRWKHVPERNDQAILEPGMVTTNEPGIYLENKYGIRTENEMLCVNAGETSDGEFLKFQTLTFCPIDLDCIDPALLTNEEKDWLNNYHQEVFNKLSKYLDSDTNIWLKKYTRAI